MMPCEDETMERNAVTVKTMTPAVLKELEDLRSRMAKRAIVYRPQIAIEETDEYVEVLAALPGFGSEEVEVFVEPRSITISGKRKADNHTKNKNVRFSDFTTGEFFRRLQLPSEADPDGARVALRDGILSLTLPKATSEEKEVNADGPSAA
jgi:HSP20 family protein